MIVYAKAGFAAIFALGPIPFAAGAMLFVRHDTPDQRYVTLAEEPRFDSIVAILADDKVIGSGVLVAERWVLTDAHVLKGVDPATTIVASGTTTFSVESVVIHPRYEDPALASDESHVVRKGVDLALVRLSKPVNGVTPAHRTTKDVAVGSEVFLCGFGSSGTGDELQPKTQPGVKRAGTNVVDALGLGTGRSRVPALYYVLDMDSADGDRNATGDAAPTELEAVGTGGDSGGGVFARVDGEWVLVGVFATARYDTGRAELQAYGTLNFITRIVEANSWIDATMAPSAKGG